MLLNVLEARPVSVADLAPEHPAALGRIVHKLLARRASERYRSAREVVRALKRMAADGPADIARRSILN